MTATSQTKKTRNQVNLPTDSRATYATCSLAMLSKRAEMFKLCTTSADEVHGVSAMSGGIGLDNMSISTLQQESLRIM